MIRLSEISTRAPEKLDKDETKKDLKKILDDLSDLQNLFYAEGKHALLVIFQGMDASGKDGAIKNVFSAMNPQGIRVTSFKTPTPEELSHDFLWRIHQHTPSKGMIGIFNRSQYEDVLITRVHGWCDDKTALTRMEAINNFERLLSLHNNTTILKFYLHVSKEEQLERLEERKVNPKKMWKYNSKDFDERDLWDKYRNMYEDCFEKCNEVPWIIVPSDQNWFKEYTIAKHVKNAFERMNMQYPSITS